MVQHVGEGGGHGVVILRRHHHKRISGLDQLVGVLQYLWRLRAVSVEVERLLEQRQVQYIRICGGGAREGLTSGCAGPLNPRQIHSQASVDAPRSHHGYPPLLQRRLHTGRT